MAGPNEQAVWINGIGYDWGAVIITVGDARFDGITSCTYGQKRERGKISSSSRQRFTMGKTLGMVKTDALKMTMNAHTWADMRIHLATLAGGLSYGDAKFDVSVIASDPAGRLPPINDLLGECTLSSENGGGEGGDSVEPLKCEIEFDFTILLRDGLSLFPDLLNG